MGLTVKEWRDANQKNLLSKSLGKEILEYLWVQIVILYYVFLIWYKIISFISRLNILIWLQTTCFQILV